VVLNNDLLMEGRSEITTTATDGNAGDIEVSAVNVSISGTPNQFATGGIAANTFGSGDAGRIQLTATNLTLTNGANIQSSTNVNTSGNAGTVTLDLAGNLVVEKGSVILGDSDGTGRAADLEITAKDISITGIRDATDPTDRLNGMFTGFDTSAGSAGQGGNVNVMAANLRLTDKAIIKTSTEGPGNGGNINVSVGNLTLSNGASVTAESSSQNNDAGNAGNIQLTAADTILLDGGTITTGAAQASGGNITLTANDMIQLVDSTIASSVQGNADTVGGDVTLDPDFIILQNSHILAKAVAGQGGNITLIANKAVLLDSQSTLDASSQTGISGSVRIESPIQVLSGTIAPLPDQPVNVATLYASRCVAGEGGHFSTFVDSKSDSVAPTPGTFLASPFLPVTGVSQQAMAHSQALSSESTLAGPEASIHFAAYTPPVLFAQAAGQTDSCP
jgi:large exoprotein involved in heme utilization and adhesion